METDGNGPDDQRPVNHRVLRLTEALSPDAQRRLARALAMVLRASARRFPRSAKGSVGGGDEGQDAHSARGRPTAEEWDQRPQAKPGS